MSEREFQMNNRLWTRGLNVIATKAKMTIGETFCFLLILALTDNNGVLELPMDYDEKNKKVVLDIETISIAAGWAHSEDAKSAFKSVFDKLLNHRQILPFKINNDENDDGRLFAFLPCFLSSQNTKRLPKAKNPNPPFVKYIGNDKNSGYELDTHCLSTYTQKFDKIAMSIDDPIIIPSSLVEARKYEGIQAENADTTNNQNGLTKYPYGAATKVIEGKIIESKKNEHKDAKFFLWLREKSKNLDYGITQELITRYETSDYTAGSGGLKITHRAIDSLFQEFKKEMGAS